MCIKRIVLKCFRRAGVCQYNSSGGWIYCYWHESGEWYRQKKLPYVLVPADKAANNVIIVCIKYYIDILVKELGINNVNINNPTTYIPIDDSFETIVKSHNQFITSAGLERSEEDQNLQYLYWTPKLLPPPQALLGFQFIDFDSLCSDGQNSKSRQKIIGSGQRSTIKIPYKVQVARP